MSAFNPGDTAIYFNGQRIGTAEGFSYKRAEEAPQALANFDLTPREFKIEVKFGANSARIIALLRHNFRPTRKMKKMVARFHKDCRKQLVRVAGRVPFDRRRMSEQDRMLCAAMGVGVPRSLR
ncbi:MAG TPA: hypothetical protein DEV93_14230 [Chloroflexi bacterium]|nr:hypothetical protein [Chloroflexota bacterium]